MEPLIVGLFTLLAIFVLIAMHVPVGVSLGITGIVGYALLAGAHPAFSLAGIELPAALGSLELAVIPMFLLMGGFAAAAGLPSDLYRIAQAFVGHRKGGLAFATIGGCAVFGALCGSSLATAATMSHIALPEMRNRGYAPSLAAGSIAAGGTLGMLIPPSLIMVIYAALTEQLVITLFVAAIIPGILAVAMHCAAIAVYVRFKPSSAPPGARTSARGRLTALGKSGTILTLGVAVTGGIYSGVFTITEAAAVGAALSFLIVVAKRRLSGEVWRNIVTQTASNTGMIYIIIVGASILTYFLTASHVPQFLVDGIQSLDQPPLVTILTLYLMYLILGSIFDALATMVITLPIVLPLIIGLGYDPVWWGVIMVMIIEVGLITPPIGINVFILHGMNRDIPLSTIFRGIVPFVVVDIARIILITVFPEIALWLPRELGLMH